MRREFYILQNFDQYLPGCVAKPYHYEDKLGMCKLHDVNSYHQVNKQTNIVWQDP